MRAFIICPWSRTITETDVQPGLRPIYAALSHETHQVERFDVVTLVRATDASHGVSLYLDDEGLLHPDVPVWGFNGSVMDRWAGRGLILGHDAEGETVAAPPLMDALRAAVVWPALVTTGRFTAGRETEAPEGFDYAFDAGRPVFATTQ